MNEKINKNGKVKFNVNALCLMGTNTCLYLTNCYVQYIYVHMYIFYTYL